MSGSILRLPTIRRMLTEVLPRHLSYVIACGEQKNTAGQSGRASRGYGEEVAECRLTSSQEELGRTVTDMMGCPCHAPQTQRNPSVPWRFLCLARGSSWSSQPDGVPSAGPAVSHHPVSGAAISGRYWWSFWPASSAPRPKSHHCGALASAVALRTTAVEMIYRLGQGQDRTGLDWKALLQ